MRTRSSSKSEIEIRRLIGPIIGTEKARMIKRGQMINVKWDERSSKEGSRQEREVKGGVKTRERG